MRKPVSIVLALIFLALGLVPLLNSFGMSLPAINAGSFGVILWILAVVGGVWLLWDAAAESGSMSPLTKPTLILGFVLLAFGLIPLLNSFGVIGFSLPSFAGIILDVLLTIAGFLLLIGGFMGFQ